MGEAKMWDWPRRPEFRPVTPLLVFDGQPKWDGASFLFILPTLQLVRRLLGGRRGGRGAPQGTLPRGPPTAEWERE